MPKSQKHPAYMRRCVSSVSKTKGLSAAFAICTNAMQKAGYLKPKSRDQTKSGEKRARQYAARKDFKSKESEYELALSRGREESFSESFLNFVIEEIE